MRESTLFLESSGVEDLESDCGVREPSVICDSVRFAFVRGVFCFAGTAFFNESGWEGLATFSILIVGVFRPLLPQKDMNRNECKMITCSKKGVFLPAYSSNKE